ncbi:MAG: PKD domain-containing protein, partial [Halobacteriales archaeon]|nr:PKD domain-containing protein [Halobacteriales archaeon]
TGPTATATFPTPGRYPITLTVLDDVGAERSVTKEILVNDRPTVEVPTTVRATAGEEVVLRARVTDSIGETTVTWHFPTGRRSVGPEATSTFPPGEFPVRVNVVDEYGASTDAIVTVVVNAQPTGDGTTTRTPTETPGSTPGSPLDGFTAITVVFALVLIYLVGRWRGHRR